MRIFCLLFLFACLAGCSSFHENCNQPTQAEFEELASMDSESFFFDHTTIFGILSNAKHYDDKIVAVDGYFVVDGQQGMLYPYREDCLFNMKRYIVVELSGDLAAHAADYSEKYIFIEGVFNARRRTSPGSSQGTLESIKRVILLKRQSESEPTGQP